MAKRNWNIDTSHSEILFTVRHMVVAKVRGSFKKWGGTVELDPENLADAKVAIQIDAASIDTRDEKRDGHLRSADFFDVERFKELRFEATRIDAQPGQKSFTLHGDLEIRGVKKPVSLQGEFLGSGKDPWGNLRTFFRVEGKINRKDFGLNWNQALEMGGVLVGEEVEMEGNLELVAA
ncbi:MAG: YceI family protein [Myxococcaceae bacterium]|nr:YceI family protein [Myxococcaceae bacterium]